MFTPSALAVLRRSIGSGHRDAARQPYTRKQTFRIYRTAAANDPLQKLPDGRQELSKFASTLPLRRLPSSTENSMTICRGR